MNIFDHEDAFADANRCAGRRTNLSEVLRSIESTDQAVRIIEEAKKTHSNLFESFIEGVEWGRANPKEKE